MLIVRLYVFKLYFKRLYRGNFHPHRNCSKVKSILQLLMIISKQHYILGESLQCFTDNSHTTILGILMERKSNKRVILIKERHNIFY
jgi:hypothetical protein